MGTSAGRNRRDRTAPPAADIPGITGATNTPDAPEPKQQAKSTGHSHGWTGFHAHRAPWSGCRTPHDFGLRQHLEAAGIIQVPPAPPLPPAPPVPPLPPLLRRPPARDDVPRWERKDDAPPWWPEGEPWPPKQAGDGKKRFLWRVGGFFTIVVLLITVASWFGAMLGRGGFPGGPLVFVVLIVALAMTARALRRTAAPIGEVMAAAEKVADGDYSVRVESPATGEVARLVETFNGMASRLQQGEESRRALVADVAHELRTPLSVVRGNVEAMLDGVYPRDDERLQLLLDETAIMTRLLEDLRTLSLSDSGVLPLHKEATDLTALVDDLLTACEPRAAKAGVALTGRVAPLESVLLDPVRVRQTLDNLLTNALRHTPRGGRVTIDVRRDGAFVRFSVADTGHGIPPEHLDRVFDRFWKSADSGGSGLGLAIARGLVEAHGGTMAVDSVPGQGAAFTFTIPHAPQPVRITPRTGSRP